MKNTIPFLFFFLLFSPFGKSQNWSPLIQGERHHFVETENPSLISTIWIENVITFEGDSISQLNKIAVREDCPDFVCGFRLNAQQFLQASFSRLSGSDQYLFQGERNFTIQAFAEIGDTWIFDNNEGAPVQAEVTAIEEGTVLGIIDSLKTIQLSNNQILVLSKKHGIVQFPVYWEGTVYELIGLQNAALGVVIPSFAAYYNFEVGDVFQYDNTESINPGTPDNRQRIFKYTILDKQMEGDTVFRYSARLVGQEIVTEFMPVVTQVLDTIELEFRDTAFLPVNQFSGQYTRIGQVAEHLLGTSEGFGLAVVQCFLEEDGSVRKTMGEFFTNPSMFEVDENDPTIGHILGPDTYFEEYIEGCGMIEMQMSWFEVWEYRTLTGFIKGGVQTGEITPDDLLLPTEELLQKSISIWLSPNPTNALLTVESETSLTANQQLQIYDASGKLVFIHQNKALGQKLELDVSHLPKGTYFLKIPFVGVRTFVKQ